jgi:hypothetical protein
MTEFLHPNNTSVKVRNTIKSDIPKIIDFRQAIISISCTIWQYMEARRTQ